MTPRQMTLFIRMADAEAVRADAIRRTLVSEEPPVWDADEYAERSQQPAPKAGLQNGSLMPRVSGYGAGGLLWIVVVALCGAWAGIAAIRWAVEAVMNRGVW